MALVKKIEAPELKFTDNINTDMFSPKSLQRIKDYDKWEQENGQNWSQISGEKHLDKILAIKAARQKTK